jgi:hypothetical protein
MLLFARKPGKKQIPHPVHKPNGFGMTYFRVFPQTAKPTARHGGLNSPLHLALLDSRRGFAAGLPGV